MSDEITQAAQESDFAQAWRPTETGSRVEGKVVSIELIDPNGRGAYPCVTLEEPDGEQIAIHAFHNVLRRELARRSPQIGDTITILYQGRREGGQNPDGYHAYRVTGGQQREFNWADELPANERESRQVSSAPPIEPSPVPGVGVGAESSRSLQDRAAERFGDDPGF